jgi:hypothetical protein
VDCLFAHNAGGHGGAIRGDVTVVRCVFDSNTASGSSGDGGAIAGNCVVQSCDFYDGYAEFGGGAISGSGTITDCLFQNNGADGGGALALGPFTVSASDFRSNYADFDSAGGVAYLYQSGAPLSTFTDCTLVQNDATYGATFLGGTLALGRCRFQNNSGGFGGLMSLNGAATNCVFSANLGTINLSSNASLTNCTITAHQGTVLKSSSPSYVTNCIFWGGTSPFVIDPTGAQYVLVNYCCIPANGPLGGVGNFYADPRLDADGRLLSPSPCIDAGDSTAVPAGTTIDAFGQPRFADDPGMPNNGRGYPPVDIGAFEFQGTTCYPNCDGSTLSPAINVADFTCFLQKYAAGNPYANCDGSTVAPILNVGDFSCFLQRFTAGCP